MKFMKTSRLIWVDYARVIACLLVVIAHCCDPFVGKLESDYSEFFAGAFWGTLMRPSVPIFAMLTGVLLLPVEMDMEDFYKRRLTRVLYPLIFWSIVTPILYMLYVNGGTSALPTSEYTLDGMFNKVIFSILNFNYDTTPLWYVYMLVGIYLALPIFSAWLKDASQKSILLFLKLWFVTLFLPAIELLAPFFGYKGVWGDFGILGECSWNNFGSFYYVSGFMGYIVLAYYLVKFPINWSVKRLWAIGLPMWLFGFLSSFISFLGVLEYLPDNFALLEIPWWFCGISVFLMTLPVFVLLQRIKWKESKMVANLASLTFGIFLSHFLVVQMSYDFLYCMPLPPFLKIPILAIVAFCVTWGVTALLKRSRFSKYIVG